MPNQPKSFFIVPSFENAEFQDTTTQAGGMFGVGSPSSTNQGALTILGTGIPTTQNIDTIQTRVQDSGSLYQTTFVYKKPTDLDHYWRGENDRRSPHLHSNPYPLEYYGADGYYGYGLSMGYTNEIEFVLVVDQTQSNSIKISYRNIFTDDLYDEDGGWNVIQKNLITDFKKKVGFSGSIASSYAQTATCTLDNGVALIFIYNGSDIDVYSTTNVTTWSLIAENIIERFIPTNISKDITFFNLCVGSSGNYVKLATTIKYQQTNYIFTMTSSDRGLSWNTSDEYLVLSGQSSTTGADRFTFSIAGIGENGSFM